MPEQLCSGIAKNNRPIFWLRCPPAASEGNILFRSKLSYLQACLLAGGNRGCARSGPCIRVFGVRQGSRRRGAEGDFPLGRRTGRDWPVMRVHPGCSHAESTRAVEQGRGGDGEQDHGERKSEVELDETHAVDV